MNQTPDVIDRAIAVISSISAMTDEQKMQADMTLRQEMGGSDRLYIRKRSPFLREVIRARYDGTMVTTRLLAKEFDVSETTVRRIGLRNRRIVAAVAPMPKPTGKAKK